MTEPKLNTAVVQHQSLPHGASPEPLQTSPKTEQHELIEQRMFDLLTPYRDECFKEGGPSAVQERKALILCENLAFWIRHRQSTFGRYVVPTDLSIAAYGWSKYLEGAGSAHFGMFVDAGSHTWSVIRVQVKPGESVLDIMSDIVENNIKAFF